MKNSLFFKATPLAFALLLTGLSSVNGWAQAAPAQSSQPAGPGRPSIGERRGPPPESVAACNLLKVDQACGFTSPKGAEKGICVKQDASTALACRPEHRGPPSEAIIACKSKALNADCTADTPEGAVKGQCVKPPGGSALACRPTVQ